MQLPEPLTGQDRTLDEISAGASATLVMFLSNHCPFVKLLKGMVFSPACVASGIEYGYHEGSRWSELNELNNA